MGSINHYERIRLALDETRRALSPFVESHLKEAFGDDARSKYAVPDWTGEEFNADVHMLANTIVNNWDDVFSKVMKREAKHLVHQVRKTRNRFAHQESFDLSDTYSALHEMHRLLEEIGADVSAIEHSKREIVDEMAHEGEVAEEIARKAEADADAALAIGARAQASLVQSSNGLKFVFSAPAVIGRSDASVGAIDIDLSDVEEAAYVSRRHARIVLEDGEFVLEDLGSSNGTYVRREEYERVDRTALRNGDEIAFGNAKFTFVSET